MAGHHAAGGVTGDWHYAVSRATRSEPDRIEARFDLEQATGQWLLSDRPEGNQRLFSALADTAHDLGGQLAFPVAHLGEEPVTVGVGASGVLRRRAVDTRRFKYLHKGPLSRDPEVIGRPADKIFTPETIGGDGFQFEETTRQTDNYAAGQELGAAFATLDATLPTRTRLLGGARVERSVQHVRTFALFDPDATPVEARVASTDVLPGLTVTQDLWDGVQLRAGVARTVSRPDFRELSPATFNDVTGGRQEYGNPDLKRATIDHVDVRLEAYPRDDESVSVGLFYKRFRDPIEQIVVVSAQHSVTYQNADGASNVGVEVEGRMWLDRIAEPLRDVVVEGNVAFVWSRVALGDGGIQSSDVRPLQGQSPWVVNLRVGWEQAETGRSVTVLYNVAGPRITEVGALGAPDTIELPVHALDLTASLPLPAGLGLSISARNLLDLGVREAMGDVVTEERREGRALSASLSWQPGRR